MIKPGPRLPQDEPPISDADLEAASRVFQALGRMTGDPRPPESNLIPRKLVRLAKRLKAMRDSRSSMLDPSLFGEPGWDILLSLFIAEGEGYRLKVTSLAFESGVSGSTVLRWIDRLLELGLIQRRPNPLDSRSTFIELHPTAIVRMTALLEQIWAKFMPID